MRILLFAIAILVGLIAVFGLVNYRRVAGFRALEASQRLGPSGPKRPVVVELFTSEGCSSCPPADALLSRLQDAQPIPGAEIIALSEHVDYWNHLGWTDPYSSAQFSARQQRYAEILGGEDIYTPQMIVGGRKAFVGSNESDAQAAIGEASGLPNLTVTLAFDNTSSKLDPPQIKLLARVEGPRPGEHDGLLDVLLAVTESGLRSSVSGGENGGRTLVHTSVVRKLMSIGSIDPKVGGTLSAQPVIQPDKSWRLDRLRAVVFVQDKSNLKIVGAAALELSGN